MAAKLTLLFCLTSWALICTAIPASGREEERLLNYLHSTAAHPLARPTLDTNEAVSVTFRTSLQHLELDEKSETLYAHHWFNYRWKDPFLAWNPANYSGIKSIRVPLGSIWNPDIKVYNSKEDAHHDESQVVLHFDGEISYFPSVHTATTCDLDLAYFPFDSQQCLIVMGSWTYNGEMVNITMPKNAMDSLNYTPNKAWRLVATKSSRVVRTYPMSSGIDHRYITLKFKVTLRRQSSYFTYVYVGPVAILSLLASSIFILPPGSSQKMTLGGALLICYSLFFLEVSYIMPPVHASTPIIDKYYMAMYIMLALSVILATIITNMAKRATTHSHPPDILKKVVLGVLGRFMCVSYTPYSNFGGSGTEELSEVKAESNTSGGGAHPGQVRYIKEWHLMATVLDRLFLIAYLVLTVLVSFSLLMSYPRV